LKRAALVVLLLAGCDQPKAPADPAVDAATAQHAEALKQQGMSAGEAADQAATGGPCRADYELVVDGRTDAEPPTLIQASAFGPSCQETTARLIVRQGFDGPVLLERRVPADSFIAKPLEVRNPDQLRQQLVDWVTIDKGGTPDMPAWPQGAANLPAQGATAASTKLDRANYEALRDKDLPLVCYKVAATLANCLALDQDSNQLTEAITQAVVD
jgi:hypothetical protein